MRGYTLGWLGAIIVVGLGTIAVVAVIATSGGRSDEQAVRSWFASPDGGAAPRSLVSAIHVDRCRPTDVSQSDPVIMCLITTDAPTTPTLHTCFQFAGDRVSRGGWQLSTLDSCNALRFDGRTGELVDMPARAHYRVTPSL